MSFPFNFQFSNSGYLPKDLINPIPGYYNANS